MNPRPSLLEALLNRLRSQLRLKLLLLLALPTLALAGYFAVQRVLIFPVRTMPLTWLDRVIPFEPAWVWVYLSLNLLNPVGPLLTRSRFELLRYTRGIAFLFASGLVCFFFFPVKGPRPAGAGGSWLYGHLIQIDRVYNSLPSLHAACAVYAVLYASYVSAGSSRPVLRKVLLCLAWLWVALILYATIATRQHFSIDLPPGIALAWLAQRLLLPRPHPAVAPKQIFFVRGEAG